MRNDARMERIQLSNDNAGKSVYTLLSGHVSVSGDVRGDVTIEMNNPYFIK